MSRSISRRAVLRGAGVALALPWLSSLAGRSALAQAQPRKLRFLPIFLPCGAPELWKPLQAGVGSEWQLSSILAPLQALKTQVTVISGLENGSVFNADGSAVVEPSMGRQAGAWLTCVDSDLVRRQLSLDEANGISADQVLAKAQNAPTSFPSLQVGLTTWQNSCDARPCSLTRSVSWASPTQPLYKVKDPGELFRKLTGAEPDSPLPNQPGSFTARKSVLDAVANSAAVVRKRLSQADRLKLDEYLSSVRELETRELGPTNGCMPPAPPLFPDVTGPNAAGQSSDTYNKGTHADLMNDLVSWALVCDSTRVISYMLEDEGSQFRYDHVPKRHFTEAGSTPLEGTCIEYVSAMRGLPDDYASITHWNVSKVASLCQKLASLPDGDGQSVLDNTVVMLGAATHGSDHTCRDLPTLLIGGGGGKLRTDQHLALNNRPMRDLYITLLNRVFGSNVADFGVNATGAPLSPIEALLA